MQDTGQRLAGIFDAIFVINLPSRADRRNELDRQLQKVGLDLSSVPVRIFPAVRPSEKGDWPSIGARGCFMSHLAVLQIAAQEGLQSILIIEDDMDWSRSFLKDPEPFLAAMEATDWEFIHGGYEGRNCKVNLENVSEKEGLRLTHFIALKANVISELVPYLRDMADRPPGCPEGGPMHVDGAYSWFRREKELSKSYIFTPSIAGQRSSRSDITQGNFSDRIPVLGPVVAKMRKIKNALRS